MRSNGDPIEIRPNEIQMGRFNRDPMGRFNRDPIEVQYRFDSPKSNWEIQYRFDGLIQERFKSGPVQ